MQSFVTKNKKCGTLEVLLNSRQLFLIRMMSFLGAAYSLFLQVFLIHLRWRSRGHGGCGWGICRHTELMGQIFYGQVKWGKSACWVGIRVGLIYYIFLIADSIVNALSGRSSPALRQSTRGLTWTKHLNSKLPLLKASLVLCSLLKRIM